MSGSTRNDARCDETHVCEYPWDALFEVPDGPQVRHCYRCDRRVHYCNSEAKAAETLTAGMKLTIAGPYADRLLADHIARAMAAEDLADKLRTGDGDVSPEDAVAWQIPPLQLLDEYRREAMHEGITAEEAEEMYPSDPFVFMIQSCVSRDELERLRALFVRFSVDDDYVMDIDGLLG